MQLSSRLFWDVDVEHLDWNENAGFIFDRVVNRGTLTDWKILMTNLGYEKGRKLALNLKNTDSKTLNFLSVYFSEEPSNFRCFTRTQLIHEL